MTGQHIELQEIEQEDMKEQGKKAYKRLGWAFLILLVFQIFVPALVMQIVYVVAPKLLQNSFFGMPLIYVCMYVIGLPLMLLVLKKSPTQKSWPTIPAKKKMPITKILMYYPALYAMVALVNYAAMLIEQWAGKTGTVTTQDIVASSVSPWVLFVFGVIVAPIMEELVFRKLVYDKAAAYGKHTYCLWVAVVFGLFHLNFGQSLYAAIMGYIFAHITYETGTVLYSIVLHMLINFTAGAGVGTIILRSGNKMALQVYSTYLTVLLLVGVVMGVVLILQHRKMKKAQQEDLQGYMQTDKEYVRKTVAFFNIGTVLFIALCSWVIFSPFFA